MDVFMFREQIFNNPATVSIGEFLPVEKRFMGTPRDFFPTNNAGHFLSF